MVSVGHRIFVGGMPESQTEESIKSRFSKVGPILECWVPKPKIGYARNFAYITYQNEEDGEKCKRVFNKTKWQGHSLRVEKAKLDHLAKLKRRWRYNPAPVEKPKVTKKRKVMFQNLDIVFKRRKVEPSSDIEDDNNRDEIMESFEEQEIGNSFQEQKMEIDISTEKDFNFEKSFLYQFFPFPKKKAANAPEPNVYPWKIEFKLKKNKSDKKDICNIQKNEVKNMKKTEEEEEEEKEVVEEESESESEKEVEDKEKTEAPEKSEASIVSAEKNTESSVIEETYKPAKKMETEKKEIMDESILIESFLEESESESEEEREDVEMSEESLQKDSEPTSSKKLSKETIEKETTTINNFKEKNSENESNSSESESEESAAEEKETKKISTATTNVCDSNKKEVKQKEIKNIPSGKTNQDNGEKNFTTLNWGSFYDKGWKPKKDKLTPMFNFSESELNDDPFAEQEKPTAVVKKKDVAKPQPKEKEEPKEKKNGRFKEEEIIKKINGIHDVWRVVLQENRNQRKNTRRF